MFACFIHENSSHCQRVNPFCLSSTFILSRPPILVWRQPTTFRQTDQTNSILSLSMLPPWIKPLHWFHLMQSVKFWLVMLMALNKLPLYQNISQYLFQPNWKWLKSCSLKSQNYLYFCHHRRIWMEKFISCLGVKSDPV